MVAYRPSIATEWPVAEEANLTVNIFFRKFLPTESVSTTTPSLHPLVQKWQRLVNRMVELCSKICVRLDMVRNCAE